MTRGICRAAGPQPSWMEGPDGIAYTAVRAAGVPNSRPWHMVGDGFGEHFPGTHYLCTVPVPAGAERRSIKRAWRERWRICRHCDCQAWQLGLTWRDGAPEDVTVMSDQGRNSAPTMITRR